MIPQQIKPLPPRKTISFDCDGVLAEGAYTPVEQRNNQTYFNKPPVDSRIPQILSQLASMYDIYVVSARSHLNANLGLRGWLMLRLGLGFDTIAGVITNPNLSEADSPMDKPKLIETLGVVAHFDDDPRQIAGMGTKGILFPSNPEYYKMLGVNIEGLPKLVDWDGIYGFLTTPGYTIHGAEYSITSPYDGEFMHKVEPTERPN